MTPRIAVFLLSILSPALGHPTQPEPQFKCNEVLNPSSENYWRYTHRWMNMYNHEKFREDPDETVKMRLAKTDQKRVEVIQLGKVDKRILKIFVDGDTVYFPINPNNSDSSVPFFCEPTPGKVIETRYSPSRSLISACSGTPLFSIKAGTNYPHLRSGKQKEKAETRNLVASALLLEPVFNAIEAAIPDEQYITMPDSLILRDRTTGRAGLIRDLSAFENGNIFEPALSLPYNGREFGPDEMWIEAYGAQVGRASARWLIKDGVKASTSMNTNPENIFIEMDKNRHPTGRLFFIDRTDFLFYRPWLEALGLKTLEAKSVEFDREPRDSVAPPEDVEDTTLVMYFQKAKPWLTHTASADGGFSSDIVFEMLNAYERAWVSEIERLLGTSDDEIKRIIGKADNYPVTVNRMDKYLHTFEGMKAMRNYHERHGTLKVLRELEQHTYNHLTLLTGASTG